VTASPLVSAAHRRAEIVIKKLAFAGPFVARFTLGVLFASTGWGKLHSLDRVTAFFTELGIPAPAFHAVLVSCVELGGGALILAGLFTRLAALPLMGTMAVAIATAQAEQVHGLPDLFGLVEWTYLVMLLWLALAGPGKLSLDQLVFGRRRELDTKPNLPASRLSPNTV